MVKKEVAETPKTKGKETTGKTKKKKVVKKRALLRLYTNAVFTGYRRGLKNQHCSTALLSLEGVRNVTSANYYMGKTCVYLFKAKLAKHVKGAPLHVKSRVRAIWGTIFKPHGCSGAVRAKFKRNLPPSAIGRRIRVMMYPSFI